MNFGDAKNMPPVFCAKLSRYLNYSGVVLTSTSAKTAQPFSISKH